MSKKSELKKAIAESEKEIDELEKKRGRSQSALLEAMLNHTDPKKNDEEYFRTYSSLIELERKKLQSLRDELAALDKKDDK